MKKFFWSFFAIVVVLLLGYGYGISYYSDKFQANTEIGQLDISNLTLDQATKKIETTLQDQTITLKEKDKAIGVVKIAEINPKVKASEKLISAYNSQDPNLWITKFFSGDEFKPEGMLDITIDQAAFNQILLDNGVDNSKRNPTKDAFIDYNENDGYSLVDAKIGNQVDVNLLKSVIATAVQEGQKEVDIKQSYTQPEVTAADKDLQAMMKKVEDAVDMKVTLDIDGNKEVIPKKDIQKWLYFDDNNQPIYDEATIAEDLQKYNDKYSTYVKERKFKSTLRGEVTVQPGTLGWSIDREAEAAELSKALQSGKDIEREPVIVGSGYGGKGDGVGTTYVEVDLVNQTMFIYKNGELALETPIVSGGPGSSTVPGAYAVWDKQQNTILRGFNTVIGEKYASPVSYWMPFDQIGQGLHDANWQPSFGGDAYLYRGSYGCINIAPDIMGTVYNLVDIGTPVIIF